MWTTSRWCLPGSRPPRATGGRRCGAVTCVPPPSAVLPLPASAASVRERSPRQPGGLERRVRGTGAKPGSRTPPRGPTATTAVSPLPAARRAACRDSRPLPRTAGWGPTQSTTESGRSPLLSGVCQGEGKRVPLAGPAGSGAVRRSPGTFQAVGRHRRESPDRRVSRPAGPSITTDARRPSYCSPRESSWPTFSIAALPSAISSPSGP